MKNNQLSTKNWTRGRIQGGGGTEGGKKGRKKKKKKKQPQPAGTICPTSDNTPQGLGDAGGKARLISNESMRAVGGGAFTRGIRTDVFNRT